MNQVQRYLSIDTVSVEVRVYGIQAPHMIQGGQYAMQVAGEWISLYASEPRISTSARPVRALDLRASTVAAPALLRFVGSLPPLLLRDAQLDLLEIGFDQDHVTIIVEVSGAFHMESEDESEPFQCRIALSDRDPLIGEAVERKKQGQRALSVRELSREDYIALADAVAVGEQPMMERIPWL